MKVSRAQSSVFFAVGASLLLFALFDLSMTERFGASSGGMLLLSFGCLSLGIWGARSSSEGRSAGPASGFRGQILLYVALMALVVVEINALGERFPWERDFTEKGLFTPARATLHWVDRLEGPTSLTVFARKGTPVAALAEALLGQLHRRNGKLSFEIVDPDLVPALAARHGVKQPWWAVIEGEGKSFSFSATTEADYANAFRRLVRDHPLRVAFVTGHGERALDDEGRLGLRKGAGALEREGGIPSVLNLVETGLVLPDTDLVVVAASKTDWTSAELEALSDYLHHGAGRLVVMVEHDRPPQWHAFLRREFGVTIERAFVVDLDEHGKNDPTALLVKNWKAHELTEGLSTVLMPGACPFRGPEASLDRGMTVLARSSKRSWGERSFRKMGYDEGEDLPGPLPLVALVEAMGETRLGSDGHPTRHRSRVLMVGDADFASNALIDSLDNGTLWLRCCLAMARDDQRIVLLPRMTEDDRIYLSRRQYRAVFFVTVLGMPFLGAVLAFHAWWMKR